MKRGFGPQTRKQQETGRQGTGDVTYSNLYSHYFSSALLCSLHTDTKATERGHAEAGLYRRRLNLVELCHTQESGVNQGPGAAPGLLIRE